MAILTGMQSRLRGSAGSVTFRRNGGMTIMSEKVTDVKVSRTEAQLRQRTKWANIVAMYKGIRFSTTALSLSQRTPLTITCS